MSYLKNLVNLARKVVGGKAAATTAPVITNPARLLAPAGYRGQTFANVNRMAADNVANNSVLANALFYGPDVVSGLAVAGTLPEEATLADRIGAGLLTTGGQVAGGRLVRGLTNKVWPKSGELGQLASDMVGGELGYHTSNVGTEALQRLASGGTTPWERASIKDRAAIEQQLLAQHGLAGYNIANTYLDPYLQQLGLG